jgi:hypothetical protein
MVVLTTIHYTAKQIIIALYTAIKETMRFTPMVVVRSLLLPMEAAETMRYTAGAARILKEMKEMTTCLAVRTRTGAKEMMF